MNLIAKKDILKSTKIYFQEFTNILLFFSFIRFFEHQNRGNIFK